MKNDARIKIDMAVKARDFSQAHPDANPGFTAAVTRLGERVTRAQALVQQEKAGHVAVRAATAAKQNLRFRIRDQLVVLGRIAAAAEAEEPGVVIPIQFSRPNINAQALLATARVSVESATPHRDLLLKFGMPDTFLDDLTGTINQFEGAIKQGNTGHAAHVGARADLDAVATELIQLVQHLDGLNRLRFRDDPELDAAWESARNVAWPKGHPAAAVQGVKPPGDGVVTPAA